MQTFVPNPQIKEEIEERLENKGTKKPVINLDELWKIAMDRVKIDVSPTNFNSWFKDLKLIRVQNGEAVIVCENPFVKDWIEKQYHKKLKKIFTEITRRETKIILTAPNSSIEKKNKEEEHPDKRYEGNYLTVEEAPIFNIEYSHQNYYESSQQKAGLNPNYLFENFIVGDSNRVAHAASEAVADNPGNAYNPLFIYGGVGLGKTHLIHAIGNRILNKDPNKKILYCSSETFLNEMVEAIRTDKNIEFRRKHRELDVLMIDDIQFISNWEKAQIELFHTFNTLQQANKQIIFASDRPPEQIEKLTDRLRSRFQGGMVADISKPEYELRSAIIKQKSQDKGISLPQNILDYLAKLYDDNIRELEGSLIKVSSHIHFGHIMPDEAEIAKILGIDPASKQRRFTSKEIIRAVCKEFNVSVRDVRGKRRTADIVLPRQVCMYLLRKELDYPLERVAKELNRLDHTTVLHAIERVEDKIAVDDRLKNRVEGVTKE
ncbi:chromosomal replication initiator protein DnaA [Candidatus Dojkabacteria bacterium]|nr:chromosomal replication initiator protein DnaA [Candidatus Dojkabacteria bacterium]